MWKNFRNVNNEIKIEDDDILDASVIQEQFTKFFEDIEVNLPNEDKLKLFPIYCKLFQVSAYGYTLSGHCFFTVIVCCMFILIFYRHLLICVVMLLLRSSRNHCMH